MAVEQAILGIISWYPCSGYEMKVEFEKGGPGFSWPLSFGTLYPKLAQLEKDGLIKIEQEIREGRPKKIYDLTARGWQELNDWLGRSPAYPLPHRDELLLKLGFWGSGRPEDRKTLVKHLEERKRESGELIEYLETWQNNGFSMIDEYGLLAIKYFQMRLQAEQSWLDLSIAQLNGPAQPPHQDPNDLLTQQKERRARALKELEID